MTTVIWITPLDDECQLCSGSFNGIMYDASINGRWGNICQTCFTSLRCKLGTGYGQRYELQNINNTQKAWVKTGG